MKFGILSIISSKFYLFLLEKVTVFQLVKKRIYILHSRNDFLLHHMFPIIYHSPGQWWAEAPLFSAIKRNSVQILFF